MSDFFLDREPFETLKYPFPLSLVPGLQAAFDAKWYKIELECERELSKAFYKLSMEQIAVIERLIQIQSEFLASQNVTYDNMELVKYTISVLHTLEQYQEFVNSINVDTAHIIANNS